MHRSTLCRSGDAVWILGLVILAGCASLPVKYVPRQIGPVAEADTNRAIRVDIETTRHNVRIGELVAFDVRIRNTSNEAVWIPKTPDLIFLWVYPDGSRDNHIRESPEAHHFRQEDAVRLEPGGQHEMEARIRTDYFPRSGIVEFRAILRVPENLNAELSPFASGQHPSNRYGIFVGSAGS